LNSLPFASPKIFIFQFAICNFQSTVRSSFMRALALLVVLTIILTMPGCTPAPHHRIEIVYSPPQSAAVQSNLPGKRPDGSVLLPNQWSLRPAGKQTELRDFPINIAVHPGGRFVAVLHSGYSAHQVTIVDLKKGEAVSHAPLTQSFYGLEFSQDGSRLFCSGAGEELVHSFDFHDGTLTNHEKIQLRDIKERAVPAGLALSHDAHTMYVANVWGDRVTRADLIPQPKISDILLRTNTGALLNTEGARISDPDTEAASKRAEVYLLQASPDDTFPYACRLDERNQRLYVSLWAQASVAVIDLKSNEVIARWLTEEHPCEMVLNSSGKLLFVANANKNTVTVLNTETGKAIETIWAALYPQSPPGSTPNSLALSPDEKTLFVANANINVVAVFDVSTPGKSRSLGFIPVGWYPTSVRVTPDGKHLLVANGKGVIPKANPLGPQPGVATSTNRTVEYIASLFRGTLSIIDLPSRAKFEKQMKEYTADAYRCSPLNASAQVTAPRPSDNPIPLKPGQPSPIKYVFYIIKENRTYDQVLGDMPQGNGDPKLCLFPERVTPNHHKLARDFVLLDNFFAESEVSADGHEWSMGAYATDFVEKMWPLNYGHNKPKKFPYPAEGNFPIATPAGGYLWDRAKDAGVTYRSYGEFVDLFTGAEQVSVARVKALQGHIDPQYRGFDLEYRDVKRTERFISELKRFEAEGEMPRLQIIRLPNDHTHGTSRRFRTPTAYVGDNDLAFGQIVEAISHSKFWPESAIFVVEDDAQNGPDHIDAHRTIALAISPYIKRGSVDSNMYSTSSMLRTIELILGLQPMSQFDAAARPMFSSFHSQPDFTPYTALPANVDLEALNGEHAWGGHIEMNFAKEDAADDLLLNEVIWRSIRGEDSPMPAPVRAAFVFSHPKDDDD
jgi:YVTN family beta-propeller protein